MILSGSNLLPSYLQGKKKLVRVSSSFVDCTPSQNIFREGVFINMQVVDKSILDSVDKKMILSREKGTGKSQWSLLPFMKGNG